MFSMASQEWYSIAFYVIKIYRYTGKNMDYHLLKIIVCPICKGSLFFNPEHTELICNADSLAYPCRDGIPVLLANFARTL